MKNLIKKPLVSLLIFVFIATTAGMSALAEDLPPSGEKLSDREMDQLLGKVALYPDPLLAQMLPASTYPLEIVEASRIIKSEKDFDKIDDQSWDPSVKAVAYYPSVLKMMDDDLEWTQRLGEAVIEQEEDVMVGVQRLRRMAHEAGNLQTTKQQIVQVSPSVIEIAPASPEIIYVPVYNPTVVYVVAAVPPPVPLITFGIGFHIGAWLDIGFYWPSHTIFYCGPVWWYGGWHRHHHHVFHDVIHHSNYRHITNVTNVTNVTNAKNVWKHNPKRAALHQNYSKDADQNQDTKKSKRDVREKKAESKKEINKKQQSNLENFKKQMGQSEKRTTKMREASNFQERKNKNGQDKNSYTEQLKTKNEDPRNRKTRSSKLSDKTREDLKSENKMPAQSHEMSRRENKVKQDYPTAKTKSSSKKLRKYPQQNNYEENGAKPSKWGN